MAPSRTSSTCRLLAILLLEASVCFALPARAEESLSQRQERIEAMTPAQKEELARRKDRFDRLTPEEQQHLCQLDRQLQSDEHSEALRQIMHRYYQWVTTLPRYEQRTLLEMPTSERLKRVRQLMADQARRTKRSHPASAPPSERARRWLFDLGLSGTATARRPSEEDLQPIQSWLEQYIERHGPKILNQLPTPQSRKIRALLDSVKDPKRQTTLWMTAWLQLQMLRSSSGPTIPNEKELAALHGKLAPELKQRLEELSPAEQRRITLMWLRLAALHQVLLNPEPTLPLVTEEELARFFDEKLDPRDRDRLLGLPPEEMQRELMLAYLRWRLADERPRQGQPSPGKHAPGSRAHPARPNPSKAK